MKRSIALALCVITLFSVLAFSGCSSNDDVMKLTVETVEVLYVEDVGFVAQAGKDIRYVSYTNASDHFDVGDRVEIEYYEYDHVVVLPEDPKGGYLWDTAVLHVQRSTKK